SGKVDLVVQGGRGREEPPDILHTEDGRETVCGVRAHERQGGPVALADVLREEAHAPRADAHGSWGKAIDVLLMQEGVLQGLCGEGSRDVVMELCCALHNFLVRLSPWQQMVY